MIFHRNDVTFIVIMNFELRIMGSQSKNRRKGTTKNAHTQEK